MVCLGQKQLEDTKLQAGFFGDRLFPGFGPEQPLRTRHHSALQRLGLMSGQLLTKASTIRALGPVEGFELEP